MHACNSPLGIHEVPEILSYFLLLTTMKDLSRQRPERVSESELMCLRAGHVCSGTRKCQAPYTWLAGNLNIQDPKTVYPVLLSTNWKVNSVQVSPAYESCFSLLEPNVAVFGPVHKPIKSIIPGHFLWTFHQLKFPHD